MKKKELQGIRTKTHEELKRLLVGKKIEMAKISADLKAGREKNVKKVKNISHDISQIATTIKEKEIIEQSAKNKEHSGK